MLAFKYSALSKGGKRVTGVIEAFDEYAAVTKLKEDCIAVLKIEEIKEKESAFQRELIPQKVSEKALAVMCSQFAIILKAGLTVGRCVDLIADKTTDKVLKKILQQASGDVAAGFSLARSLENKGAKVLPATLIESISSGEESGTLAETFRRLEKYYDKSAKTKGKIRSAMTYPLFTIAVAIIVVGVIMTVGVPVFTATFMEMDIELPFPTRLLIAVSNFFAGNWFWMAILIVGGALAWKTWGRTEEGCIKQHRWMLEYPLIGKLNHMKIAGQFANTMSTMLAAQIPLVQAVGITARVLDNRYVGSQLDKQLPDMEAGFTMTDCLRASGVLPDLLVEMAGVGESTGTLESTLDVIADYYDAETENMSQRILSLLEPVFICILAFVVVLILLAVYLPMFGMYDGIL